MRTLVVIPTYNEIRNIGRIVPAVLDAQPDVDVLIVDDGSPDGTGARADELAAADPRVAVLHRTTKSGLGGAYRAGFGWGLERGYEVLVEMDADLSHDPAQLHRLRDALGRADLVIGSRYIPAGAVVDWPAHRLALSRGGNRYVRAVAGLPVSDATSGYRAFRRAVLEDLDLSTIRSEGYSFQLEMALRTYRAGFRVVEVPITFTERQEGASKISRSIVVEALWRVVQWGVQSPRSPSGVHPRSVVATSSSV